MCDFHIELQTTEKKSSYTQEIGWFNLGEHIYISSYICINRYINCSFPSFFLSPCTNFFPACCSNSVLFLINPPLAHVMHILYYRSIMRTTLFYIIVVVGVTTVVNSSENESSRTRRLLLDSTQESQIKGGFDAATNLFDKMDKLDFGGVTGALVGSVSSFLGAVGPFVGLVLSLFSGPSAEYQLLKRMFTQVENRFDKVDVQFAALRRQVRFVATQVHFTDLESNIIAVQSGLKVLSQVTNSAGYRSESHEFIHTYDRTYESAGIKLYHAIIHGGALTGGLFHEFMTHSTYDRKATQRFMIGTLNLLMRASALEMTYAQLKHDPNLAIKRRNWISHFTQVKSKMIAIDNEVVKHYHSQMVSDINTFGTLHPKGSLSNTDFSSQLFSKLTSKVILKVIDHLTPAS